jgi:glutaredoxin-like YruB-family protein
MPKGGFIPVAKKVDKKVVIYSTPDCPICKRAKAYLTKKGIGYKDIDVSANEETAHEMIHRSGQMGTPVIFVGEQMMVGFNQKKMDEMLAK